jgi:ATP-dependent DNA helicase RecG
MEKEKLIELIQGGENSRVEFKRESIRPEKLAKEIAAMANLNGGSILIGVEDDGTISGVSRKNMSEWIFDTVLGRYIHPLLFPFYEEVDFDGKKVVVLSFDQGTSKPYVVRNNNREEVYIRLGSVTKLAAREQQLRLYAAGGMLQTELLPVAGTSIQTLDRARLDNYLRDIIRDPDPPVSENEWIDRLKGLGFLTCDAVGATVCTIAGLVLFGIRPRLPLRQSGIRLMAFRGLDKEYQALLDVVLDAPMVGRWQIDKSQRRLIDSGLIEKFIDQITPFITEEAAEIDENFRREKKWFYPLEAVRETVINALAHRDWTRSVDVEVGVYSDRLEVISPGSLPDSMSIEKVIAGRRSSRNQIIMEVLRDYGYVDARGMGIRTKVIPNMKAAGSNAEFETSEDFFKTTLRKTAVYGDGSVYESRPATGYTVRENPHKGSINRVAFEEKRKNSTDKDLLNFLISNPDATYEMAAKALEVSPATVKRKIQVLKKRSLLKRVGSKKTGRWAVSTPENRVIYTTR